MSVTQRLKEALFASQFWDSRLQHRLEVGRAVLTISRWTDGVAGGGPGGAGGLPQPFPFPDLPAAPGQVQPKTFSLLLGASHLLVQFP